MPEKVPLWVIRNAFTAFGSRMPQRPPNLGIDLKVCATCEKELPNYHDWEYCAGKYYCNAHIDAARAEDRKSWGRGYTPPRLYGVDAAEDEGMEYTEFGIHARASGISIVPRTEAEIPEGNLDETDYAFWIGNCERYTAGAKSLRAMCRACGECVFYESGRQEHKKASTKLYKEGLSCPKVLMLAYQQLLKQDECLVCKLKCHGRQKWGVPLCCPNCIKVWKFTESMEYPSLEIAIMEFWTSGDQASGGSKTSESTSSPIQIVSSRAEGE